MATTTKTRQQFDMTTPIAIATISMRDEACANALEHSLATINRVLKWLETGYTPTYPLRDNARGYYSPEWKRKHHEYTKHLELWRKLVGHNGDGYVVCKTKADAFIAQNQDIAISSWEAFVTKLIHKTGGDVVAAELLPCRLNQAWTYSIIRVTLADGTIQNWKTQSIVNRSSLGTYFNQFPTRQVK